MKKNFKKLGSTLMFMLMFMSSRAQVGVDDLFDEVETQITSMTDYIPIIAYSIAGVLLMIAAVTVLPKIAKGQDSSKEIMAWGGAIVFFVIAGALAQFIMA